MGSTRPARQPRHETLHHRNRIQLQGELPHHTAGGAALLACRQMQGQRSCPGSPSTPATRCRDSATALIAHAHPPPGVTPPPPPKGCAPAGLPVRHGPPALHVYQAPLALDLAAVRHLVGLQHGVWCHSR